MRACELFLKSQNTLFVKSEHIIHLDTRPEPHTFVIFFGTLFILINPPKSSYYQSSTPVGVVLGIAILTAIIQKPALLRIYHIHKPLYKTCNL